MREASSLSGLSSESSNNLSSLRRELSKPISRPEVPKPLADTPSTLERHSDAPAANEETCCFVRCLTYIKDKIVSFFKQLAECLCPKRATQDEIKAVRNEIGGEITQTTTAIIETIKSIFDSCMLTVPQPPVKDIDYLMLATAIDGFSLYAQGMSNFAEIMRAKDLSHSKLQSDKAKILASFSLAKKVKPALKLTLALQEKVENFSLEKTQLHHDPKFKSNESLDTLFKTLQLCEFNYSQQLLNLVNEIRDKNRMSPITMPPPLTRSESA